MIILLQLLLYTIYDDNNGDDNTEDYNPATDYNNNNDYSKN